MKAVILSGMLLVGLLIGKGGRDAGELFYERLQNAGAEQDEKQ